MDWINFFTTNGALIAAHPVPFVTLGVLAFLAGWGVAYLVLKQAITNHKDRADHWKEKFEGANNSQDTPVGPGQFDYPKAGFYGLNILSDSLSEVEAGAACSMTAHVPTGKKLRIHIVGPSPDTLSDVMGAWQFNVALRNWVAQSYDHTQHSQWFEAAPGDADLQFFASRLGELTVSAYEDGRDATWTKKISVVARNPVATSVPSIQVPAVFSPNSQQDWVIRILRQLDGEWLSLADLRRFPTVSAWQDLVEDVKGLELRGWLEAHSDNGIKNEAWHSYRLRGPGLAYAREKGYPTGAQLTAGQPLPGTDVKPYT